MLKMHFLFWQKQRVINSQQFGRRFPLHPLFYLCWTILVGRISSVKWIGVQLVALCLGVIIFDPFQIEHFKRVFDLLIIEFSFCVSKEICDDRRQKKCGLISTLIIALFRTYGALLTPGYLLALLNTLHPAHEMHLVG